MVLYTVDRRKITHTSDEDYNVGFFLSAQQAKEYALELANSVENEEVFFYVNEWRTFGMYYLRDNAVVIYELFVDANGIKVRKDNITHA
tara:strand:+ start:729 stop:995 length:267 start_codon:yes stop_codon:yes gene_type:complete